MSLVSKYGVKIPFGLLFIGVAVMFGTLMLSGSAAQRIAGYVGGLLSAGGLLWSYLVASK